MDGLGRNSFLSPPRLSATRKALRHSVGRYARFYVIKSYSDLVNEMQKKRAGKFTATQYGSSSGAADRSAGKNSRENQSPRLPALSAPGMADRSYSGGRVESKSSPGRSAGGLDDVAKSSSGDILGQLGMQQNDGTVSGTPRGPPPPTLSQEEAFAQIKGVDYSMQGTRARKKKNPNRPVGARNAMTGRSPRANKKRNR